SAGLQRSDASRAVRSNRTRTIVFEPAIGSAASVLRMFDSSTAREFTRFTANPHCGPVIAPACCSAEAAIRHFGSSAMNHQDGPDVFGARELTPVEEELWSLKVVMAKTGLSRSTLYAYIAVG